VFKNLRDAWNTCFANVHCWLYAVHMTKVHEFASILDKFCSEMACLSTVGFQGTFSILGQATLHVYLDPREFDGS
jgi:hypothetical protein